MDDAGELYVLTKADGMIRKVVGAEATTAAAVPASAPPPTAPGPSGADLTRPQAAALKNPVPATPTSIAAGKARLRRTCAACHGDRAQGAVKAKLSISIIEEQGGKQPPDLTDDQWDYGSTDGEIYAVIEAGRSADDDAGVRRRHLGRRHRGASSTTFERSRRRNSRGLHPGPKLDVQALALQVQALARRRRAAPRPARAGPWHSSSARTMEARSSSSVASASD